MKKIAIVTGGYSSESVVSVKSAAVNLQHIDKSKYDPYLVEIFPNEWNLVKDDKKYPIDKNDFSATIDGTKITFDAILLILHGTPGEDGILQAYFDLLGIPYTSSGRLTSTVTFGKNIGHTMAKSFGALVTKSILFDDITKINTDEVINELGLPCFVKPNNGGSSIGMSKVATKEQLIPAIEKAFKEDANEIQVEQFIEGTEITCGVLQKVDELVAMPITEIVSKKDFFDFEAKYDSKLVEEITPARISKELEEKCKTMSVDLFKKFNCKGVARFDYIIKGTDLYFLEVNTIPGMSAESIVPQQAKKMGISLTELIDILISNVL